MPPQKKTGPRSGKKNRQKKRLLLPGAAILLLLASLGAAFYFVFLRVGPPAPSEISADAGQQGRPGPRPERLPAPEHRLRSTSPRTSKPKPGRPRVAIVIDDMGIQREAGEHLLRLDLDLTFSFLPYAPHTKALARTAKRLGRDILLHLPMEPENTGRWDPGLGALYLAMPAAALRLHVEKDLSLVPMAIGVNNHMGSKFTANRQAMRTVLALFRTRGLFFLDSLTTAASVGYQVATEIGVPARRRDLFLDNVQEQEAIERQLDALIRIARQKGTAIAIGHPHPATVAALTAYRKRLCSAVQVVGLHRLIPEPHK